MQPGDDGGKIPRSGDSPVLDDGQCDRRHRGSHLWNLQALLDGGNHHGFRNRIFRMNAGCQHQCGKEGQDTTHFGTGSAFFLYVT